MQQCPEGARQGSLLGTYLHGPVLARNPALADLLLGHVLARRDLPHDPPPPAAEDRAAALHQARLRAALGRRTVGRGSGGPRR
jgi:hypothetical protein